MPSCIIGVNLGIIVNIMTPEPIVLGFLILALIYLVISTGLKWWSVRKRERKNMSVLAIKVEESSVSEHANEIELPSATTTFRAMTLEEETPIPNVKPEEDSPDSP